MKIIISFEEFMKKAMFNLVGEFGLKARTKYNYHVEIDNRNQACEIHFEEVNPIL